MTPVCVVGQVDEKDKFECISSLSFYQYENETYKAKRFGEEVARETLRDIRNYFNV